MLFAAEYSPITLEILQVIFVRQIGRRKRAYRYGNRTLKPKQPEAF